MRRETGDLTKKTIDQQPLATSPTEHRHRHLFIQTENLRILFTCKIDNFLFVTSMVPRSKTDPSQESSKQSIYFPDIMDSQH